MLYLLQLLAAIPNKDRPILLVCLVTDGVSKNLTAAADLARCHERVNNAEREATRRRTRRGRCCWCMQARIQDLTRQQTMASAGLVSEPLTGSRGGVSGGPSSLKLKAFPEAESFVHFYTQEGRKFKDL